jgi:hypothetical protein
MPTPLSRCRDCPLSRARADSSQAFQVRLRFFQFREEALFGLELAGVDTAAASLDAYGMLEVEHLVVQQILDRTTRGVGAVEDAADDDGVVSGVVVAKHAAGMMCAPRQGRAAKQAVEETCVEGLEDLIEIVVVAGGCGEAFASSGLPYVFGLFGDRLGGDVAAVAIGMGARDGLLVELREKDMGDGMVYGLGCGLEKVREAHVKAAFAQTNRRIQRGKSAEADVERWNGRTRPEFAVLLLEDGDERS